ncbi:uncharacterized protein SAPINGB_P002519 [Magnusiomyces paraingens]|uniref:Cas1p 10 TM acyl transferase domain-containing protein n=1 Tax=Magnusiomyces paraingens TaxID=2606893 RepID=A0A5E8BK35_9ASCO|nr:uncharacterized protein SAPINGB_P002519 [Saprochaete ingens]VVT49937.1 unnamed protein product [Saprochaete ingens]
MSQYGSSVNNCDSVLKYGRYIHDTDDHPTGWQPDGCALKQYSYHDLNLCLKPGDEIIFYGDSTARQAFWGFINTLFHKKMQTLGAHHFVPFISDEIKTSFIWDEYFNGTGLTTIKDIALNGHHSKEKTEALGYNKDPNYTPKTYLYVAGGAWFAYTEEPSEVANIYRRNVEDLLQVLDFRVENAFDAVYFGTPLIPYYSLLNEIRRDKLTLDQFNIMIRISDELFNFQRTNQSVASAIHPTLQHGGVRYRTREGYTDQISAYYLPVVNELGAENHVALYDDILVHYTESTYLLHGSILINHMCNQRLIESTKKPLAGGSCCAQYKSDKAFKLLEVLKVSIPVICFAVAAHLFKKFRHLTKPLCISVSIIGLVSLWAHISNEKNLISKSSISFSSSELVGLLQIWTLLSLLSLSDYLSEQESNAGPLKTFHLSETFLAECRGICVSLLLIIQFTGGRELVETFDFEILARVLISIWSMAQVYSMSFAYLDKLENAKDLKKSYISIFSVFIKTLARVLTLPLFLSINITDTFGTNLIPGSIPQSYVDLAAKLFFWSVFTYFVVPLCVCHHQWQGLIFFAASFTAWFLLPEIYCVRNDFWAISLTIFLALTSNSHFLTLLKAKLLENSKISFITFPTVALIIFLILVNLVKNIFAYFIFTNPNGLNNPMSYIELHTDVYDEYLNKRGQNYTPVVHSIIALVASICYIIIRSSILKLVQTDFGGSSKQYYASCWVSLGRFSYEALELYPYIFLAASGTLRLHYFPTGVVNSSFVTRTLYFVDESFKFPFFQWRVWEKVRKCASIAISVGVLCILAEASASVWKNLDAPMNNNEETDEVELESQKE